MIVKVLQFKIKNQLPMWHQLSSPPENFRFYKYSEHSADQQQSTMNINLDQNRTTLFASKDQHLSGVPEESLVQTYGKTISSGTNKPLSSLVSTTKINNRSRNQKSALDLNVKSKTSNGKKQPKSMFESSSKKKPTKILSQNNHSSSIIRQEGSIVTSSSKNNRSSNNKNKKDQSFLLSVNNQEDQESFSRIMINQINKNDFSRNLKENVPYNDPNYLYQMVMTLRQIRDISKQNLATNRKLIKLIQDKNQISFLYDKDQKSDIKVPKPKKTDSKNFKRSEQKSTIKKLSRNFLQERINKVEQKVKLLTKRIEDESINKKVAVLSKTKKKSMSTLR